MPAVTEGVEDRIKPVFFLSPVDIPIASEAALLDKPPTDDPLVISEFSHIE